MKLAMSFQPNPRLLAPTSHALAPSTLAPSTLAGSVLALCLLASAPLGAAPPLADPTRPPDFAAGASPTAAVAAAAARSADAALRTPLPRQLQAVQTSARGVATALIDARVVRVGDVLGDGPGAVTVQAIDADGVTLRGPHYQQRLALAPGGTKTLSAGPVEIVITRSRASTGTVASGPAGAITFAPPAPRPALRPSEATKELP